MRDTKEPVFWVAVDIGVLIVLHLLVWLIGENGELGEYGFNKLANSFFILLVAFIINLYYRNIYRRSWMHVNITDLIDLAAAGILGIVCYLLGVQFILGAIESIHVIIALLGGAFVMLTRMIAHYFLSYGKAALTGRIEKRVMIIGAGAAGAIIANEIIRFRPDNRKLVGFIDDDVKKNNQVLLGKMVLGGREDAPRLIERYKVDEVIIAMPSIDKEEIKKIIELCIPMKVDIKVLPGLYELLDGDIKVSSLKEVSVEDLLARKPVKLDEEEIKKFLKDKTVLISGAGGSIGSEICRQIAKMEPARLLLLGHGENSIYLIHQELSNFYGKEFSMPLICDIRDREVLTTIFQQYKPDIVFHAAAHKHVPLMEEQPKSAVLNNVIGTKVIAEVAGESNVEAFVMISTDKAVNSTNVMGATKAVAEKVVQACNDTYATKFMVVRFGNVLGSRGSVIPLFKKQLEAGGPLTVTHLEMTRYFMTIPEASQLVLQAGTIGEGGEVFLLDMGEPIKIVDLARNMIRLSGFEPDVDIKIEVTGIRPGEKLYEELLTQEEGATHTKHDKIYQAQLVHVNKDALYEGVEQLVRAESKEDIVKILKELVPTYNPSGK